MRSGRSALRIFARRCPRRERGQPAKGAEPLEDWAPAQAGRPPEEASSRRELTAQAMARLPARQRTVLLLKYDRGLDNREIARVLDMTVSAVERTVSRAKARLREALEGLGVEV